MFDKTDLKTKIGEYLKTHEAASIQEIVAEARSWLGEEAYAVARAEIEHIANWYLTMQKEQQTGQWYHTLEINGHTTDGMYDLRPYLRRYCFPSSLRGKRVLDVGPADGFFSFHFEKLGGEVTALEAYENQHFREAKQALGSGVDYRIGDVYDLNSRKWGVFDLVFCATVLCHLSDPFKALVNMRAVLAPGGCFICSTPVARFPNPLLSPLNLVLDRMPVAALSPRRRAVGKVDAFWFPTVRCFRDMLFKTGWEDIRLVDCFNLAENNKLLETTRTYPIAVYHAFG